MVIHKIVLSLRGELTLHFGKIQHLLTITYK